MPIKSSKVNTMVSPVVCTVRVGTMNAAMPLPSISELIRPEANAKNDARYATATIPATFEDVVSMIQSL